jgi:hypothetical protein
MEQERWRKRLASYAGVDPDLASGRYLFFMRLTHTQLLFAYEHRRHLEALIFCVSDRQEPRCVCHVGPPNNGRIFF